MSKLQTVAEVQATVHVIQARLEEAEARDYSHVHIAGIEASDAQDWKLIAAHLGTAYRAACAIRDAKKEAEETKAVFDFEAQGEKSALEKAYEGKMTIEGVEIKS